MHVTKAQSLIKAFFQNNLTSLVKLGEELLGHSVSLRVLLQTFPIASLFLPHASKSFSFHASLS